MQLCSNVYKTITTCSLVLLCSACTTPLFRANFSGASLGPFSNFSTGDFEQSSSPEGDIVVGSNLEPTSVRFVTSFAPDGNAALMLAPNPTTSSTRPTIEFRPVSADPDHIQRTFYWDGKKKGYMAMDCVFRDMSDGDHITTLRFVDGNVLLFLPDVGGYNSNKAIIVGNVPTSKPHQVWITFKPETKGGDIKISPLGELPISFTGFPIPLFPTIGGAKINMTCAYEGFGSASQENYVFDNMIFRSEKLEN